MVAVGYGAGPGPPGCFPPGWQKAVSRQLPSTQKSLVMPSAEGPLLNHAIAVALNYCCDDGVWINGWIRVGRCLLLGPVAPFHPVYLLHNGACTYWLYVILSMLKYITGSLVSPG